MSNPNRIVPDHRLGKLQFYESHLEPWMLNTAALGLSPSAMDELEALTAAARADYNAHLAAQNAAKAATQKFYDSIRALHGGAGAGADMIQTIKNHAQTTGNTNVYNLAQIPPPSTPGTLAAPGTPTNFTTALRQDGSLELAWKCSNPSGAVGTLYEVKRRLGIPSDGEFEYLGTTGTKSFIDSTLPAGASPWTYQITALRSARGARGGTARGHTAQFVVNFGAVAHRTPMKLAA